MHDLVHVQNLFSASRRILLKQPFVFGYHAQLSHLELGLKPLTFISQIELTIIQGSSLVLKIQNVACQTVSPASYIACFPPPIPCVNLEETPHTSQ